MFNSRSIIVIGGLIGSVVLVAIGIFVGYQLKDKSNKSDNSATQTTSSSNALSSSSSSLQIGQIDNSYYENLGIAKEFGYTIIFSENNVGQNFSDMTNYNPTDVKRFYKYQFGIDNYPHTATFVEEYSTEEKAKARVNQEINFRVGAWEDYAKLDKNLMNENIKYYGDVEVVERTLQQYRDDSVSFGVNTSFPWRIAVWRKDNLVMIHYWSERDSDANPEKYIPLMIGYFENEKLQEAKVPKEVNGNKIAYYHNESNDENTEPRFREEIYYTNGKELMGFMADTISNDPRDYCAFSGMIPAGGDEAASSSFDLQKLIDDCMKELNESPTKLIEQKRNAYDTYNDAVATKSYENTWDCKMKNDGGGYCVNKESTIGIYLRFPDNFSASLMDTFMKAVFNQYSFENINKQQ